MAILKISTAIFLFYVFWTASPIVAQAGFEDRGQPIQVFVQHDIDDLGTDRIHFVDSLTGMENSVAVYGDHYTTVGRSVLYFDLTQNQVVLVAADGEIQGHPFIQPSASTRRVDWVISDDGEQIAWTLTDSNELGQLITTTTVANLDGTQPQQILVDGPRDGIRVMPIAFNRDHSILYMDYQPDGIGDFIPFQQFAGLFAVDITSKSIEMLPGEPGCYCGAGIGAGKFLRLALTQDLNGFDLHLYDLDAEVDYTIPAEPLRGYTQAGGVVISPDGARAIYALAQVSDFGGQNQFIRTVFMMVDLENMTQTTLTTQPISSYLLPHSWTEDDSAVIFTSPDENGTWKIGLDNTTLNKIAEATYVGTLR